MRTINIASAAIPGYRHVESVRRAYLGVTEAFGEASTAEMQLCPQHPGVMDEKAAEAIREQYPNTQFRLHANVRIEHEFHKFDASTPWRLSEPYFRTMAAVNMTLGGQTYSLHAGRRATADLGQMSETVRRVEEVLGIPVAVEGLYPDPKNGYLLSTWDEYAWLRDSGLNFAIDLSHLNIVVYRSRERRDDLVKELISSERCMEIHISGNDGRKDAHQPVDGKEWWWGLLDAANPSATFFTEGMNLDR